MDVMVADNDAAGSARNICDTIRPNFKWNLVYDVEPQQGVTFARNHSVAMASPNTDFIVFIDDDEFPSPQWLEQLLTVQQSLQADVVTGPVIPQFESDPTPPWIIKGGFFDPPQRVTGQILHIAYTHNSLIRASLLRNLDVLFDSTFAFRGSEDVHLFMRLFQQGAKIVWAQDATVYESIPIKRTQLKWLLERNFYGWSSHSLLESQFSPYLHSKALRLTKGTTLLTIGLCTTLPSLFLGKHAFAKALIFISRGLGTLSGLLGSQGGWDGSKR